MSNMKNDKKIVIICPYLFRLTRGIERFCISLSKAFVDKGYNVVIYAWNEKKETTCGEIDQRIKIRKVPYCRWHQEKVAVFYYRCWLRMDNPKATILNFLYHGESLLPRKRKYLYVLHSPASQIPKRYEFVKNHIGIFEDMHVVAISKMVEKEAYPYIGKTPITMIYNGTDTELFIPSMHKIKNGKFNIITAAAFEERKGIHYMIEALGDYPHRNRIQYDIYGSGDFEYGEYLKSLINKYHLENVVHLKGSISNISEIEPRYDLLAFLSKGEAFGLAITEAMACGLPILSSDLPPFPEIVKSEYGYMVEPTDKNSIHKCLDILLSDPEILRVKSYAAYKASKSFSWDIVVRQYIDLINLDS